MRFPHTAFTRTRWKLHCGLLRIQGHLTQRVVQAVNLGEDANTVGAVNGQLAGAAYCSGRVPERCLDRLAWRNTSWKSWLAELGEDRWSSGGPAGILGRGVNMGL